MIWIIVSLLGLGGGAYFLTRESQGTSRTPSAPQTQVGADPPDPVLKAMANLAAHLARHDVPSVRAEYHDAERTVVFVYLDADKAARATDLLPQSLSIDAKHYRFLAAVRNASDVDVGRIDATSQETPWTCGPAALRAVMAHYGHAVTEPELTAASDLAPAIGARPEGLVKAARAHGFLADVRIMSSVADLAELLARGIPAIVIVDSWTHPGRVGHYVVVVKVDRARSLVTVMDPHTEGCWRMMTVADFDARWWAKRQGPDGRPLIVRHVAVVVEPGEGMAVAVGKESPVKPPEVPAHGRTAKCNPPGGFWHWWGKIFTTGSKMIFKGAANYFTGGAYSTSGLDKAVDKVLTHTSKLDAGKMRDFMNTASNEEIAAWGIGQARDKIKVRIEKFDPKKTNYVMPLDRSIAGLSLKQLQDAQKLLTDLDDINGALTFVWRLYFSNPRTGYVKNCQHLHVLQACAVLLYGGVDVVPVLDAVLKVGRPKVDGKPIPVEMWREGIVKRLEAFRATKEAAAVKAGPGE